MHDPRILLNHHILGCHFLFGGIVVVGLVFLAGRFENTIVICRIGDNAVSTQPRFKVEKI